MDLKSYGDLYIANQQDHSQHWLIIHLNEVCLFNCLSWFDQVYSLILNIDNLSKYFDNIIFKSSNQWQKNQQGIFSIFKL